MLFYRCGQCQHRWHTAVISPLLLRSTFLKCHLSKQPNRNILFLLTSGHSAAHVVNKTPSGMAEEFFNHPFLDHQFFSALKFIQSPFHWLNTLLFVFFACMRQRCPGLSDTWLCFFLQLQNRFAHGRNRFFSACCLCVYLGERAEEQQTVSHGKSPPNSKLIKKASNRQWNIVSKTTKNQKQWYIKMKRPL